MKDRNIYDRERARKLYTEFQERREKVLEILGGKCYLCDKKAEKGFHLHHVEYHEIESAYPRDSKSMWIRWKRLKEAESNPKRFKLLCPKCHRLISGLEYLIESIDKKKLRKLLKF